MSYSPTGSSQGIEGVLTDRVDFGGSEAPLTPEQLGKAGEVLQIPTTLGAVTVVYNIAGAWNNMKLTPEVLAAIFLCEITNWNDTRISWLNGGSPLPSTPIQIIHRKDGSGTTKVFTDYLTKVSPTWKERVGAGNKVQWPCGKGEDGNAGVTDGVKRTAGAIGYVSLGFARVARLYVAAIGNRAGQFVEPSLDSVTAAAAAAAVQPGHDPLQSIVDADGEASYPISSFSYIIVRREVGERGKARTLADFLWWAVHDGQSYSPFQHFATLPPEIVAHAEQQIRSLRSQGQPLLAAQ